MGHEQLALEAAELTAKELGVDIYEYPGWSTRGHYSMTAVKGMLWHDTVTTSRVSTGRLWELLAEGYTGLPGPIANMGVERDGTIGLIAAEGAYHAGSGGPWKDVPRDDGNRLLWGIEVANAGLGSGERWTGIQYDVCVVFSHHFLRLLKEHGYDLLGHKEWTSRKVDPWSINMSVARDNTYEFISPTPTKPIDDLEQLMGELNKDQKEALEALAALGPDGANHLVKFSNEITRRSSSGNGVAMAAIDDHRQRRDAGFSGEMYDILVKFITGIEEMNSEPRFLSEVLVAAVREGRARGWLMDPSVFNENVLYRFSDGQLESSDDGESWQPVTDGDGEPVMLPDPPVLATDPEAGVGTNDADPDAEPDPATGV